MIPLKLSAASRPAEKYYTIISVNWGVVRIRAEIIEGMMVRLRVAGIKIMQKPLSGFKTGEKEEKEEDTEETGLSLDMIFSLTDDIIRILSELSFGHFYMKLRFGLNDSADTGIVYGFLMALKGILYAEKRVVLEACPDFGSDLVFEPECDLQILVGRVYRLFSPSYSLYKKVSAKKQNKVRVGVL